MRTRLWLTVMGIFVWAAAARAAGDEGGEARPASWLNWLYNVRIGGHPLATEPADVAFAFALLLVLALIIAAIRGGRGLSVRPGPFQVLLETAYSALQSTVEGVMGERAAGFSALHRNHLPVRLPH